MHTPLPKRRLICALLFGLPLLRTTQAMGLPDTGLTRQFTHTFGEDSDYVGHAPAYRDNGDGTISDLVTGLIWQQIDAGELRWDQAKNYALGLDLANHKDWRLPNSMELFSILDHGRQRPAMDTRYFPNSGAEYWWTNQTRVDDASKVWSANAGGGIGAHPMRETISAGGQKKFHVRCVRGSSLLSTGPHLIDGKDGTINDANTSLVWQTIGTSEAMNWENALRYCEGLKLAGQDDWRLPNVKELRSICDDLLINPAVDKTFFPRIGFSGDLYWSSTSLGNRPERAWHVDLSSGLVSYSDKPKLLAVLAVRGGDVRAGPKEKAAPIPNEPRERERRS